MMRCAFMWQPISKYGEAEFQEACVVMRHGVRRIPRYMQYMAEQVP
jgi:hypothetical protein